MLAIEVSVLLFFIQNPKRNSELVMEQYIRCGLCLEYGAGREADALKIYSRFNGLSNWILLLLFLLLLLLLLLLLFLNIFKINLPIELGLLVVFGILISLLFDENDELRRFFKNSLTCFSYKLKIILYH